MADTNTSQNIELSSWITLYIIIRFFQPVGLGAEVSNLLWLMRYAVWSWTWCLYFRILALLSFPIRYITQHED